MRHLVFIALALLSLSLAARPEVQVETIPTEVVFGEPFTIEISSTRDALDEIESITLDKGPIASMRRAERVDEQDLGNGQIAERWELTAHGFEAGPAELPALLVTWTGGGAVSAESVATDQMLTVLSSFASGPAFAEPHGLKGPFRMETEFPRWPFIAALVLIIAAWLIRMMMKRRGIEVTEEAAPAIPAIPPLEKALQALKALRDSDLVAKGMQREFFYQMTETVKVFFEEDLGIGAPEMTSHELRAALHRAGFPMDLNAQFDAWVSASDLIKYARQSASEQQCNEAIDLACAIVTASHQHALAQRRSEEAVA